MSTPIISIIVPVYNVEKYLHQCVQSILDQTIQNIEIILVNDGSTDMSSTICNEFKEKDHRIVVINKANGGLSDARNIGIKAAKGKYIAFVDSDDFIHKEMLKKMYQRIIIDGSDMAVCGYIQYYNNVKKNEQYIYGKDEVICPAQFFGSILSDEKIGNYAWNKIYKKELFAEVTFPKGKAFEDINTTYKLVLLSDKISIINEALYYYRQRWNSISNSVNVDNLRNQIDAIVERNKTISSKFPYLMKKCKINELKFYVINYNQISKKYKYGFKELIWYRNNIIELSRYYKLNGTKYCLICFCIIRLPIIYSSLIYLIAHIKNR